MAITINEAAAGHYSGRVVFKNGKARLGQVRACKDGFWILSRTGKFSQTFAYNDVESFELAV